MPNRSSDAPDLSPRAFRIIVEFVKERAGLVVRDDRQYLVNHRLTVLLSRYGLASFDDLARALQRAADDDDGLCRCVVDALTTNESSFFRDRAPFQVLTDTVLPSLLSARDAGAIAPIRIWCAAASTGQEPYSAAISLEEARPRLGNFRYEILGSDISHTALEKARSRTYTQFEVQRGMPIALLARHFTKDGNRWKINASIAAPITWKQLNLMDAFPHLGRFDVIFCRNVLIYFDEATKRSVLSRLHRQLSHSGVLVLGSVETIVGLDVDFDPLGKNTRGFYVARHRVRPPRALAVAPSLVGHG